MRDNLKFLSCVVLVVTIAFISCRKQYNGRLSYVPDPSAILKGKEFIFDTLTWKLANEGGGDEVFVITTDRPDLFYSNAPKEVYLMLDSVSVWMITPQENNSLPSSTPYFYDISLHNSDAYLYVESNYPPNYHLVGRRAAIKVKFL